MWNPGMSPEIEKNVSIKIMVKKKKKIMVKSKLTVV